jgi:hypothetical protein
MSVVFWILILAFLNGHWSTLFALVSNSGCSLELLSLTELFPVIKNTIYVLCLFTANEYRRL